MFQYYSFVSNWKFIHSWVEREFFYDLGGKSAANFSMLRR